MALQTTLRRFAVVLPAVLVMACGDAADDGTTASEPADRRAEGDSGGPGGAANGGSSVGNAGKKDSIVDERANAGGSAHDDVTASGGSTMGGAGSGPGVGGQSAKGGAAGAVGTSGASGKGGTGGASGKGGTGGTGGASGKGGTGGASGKGGTGGASGKGGTGGASGKGGTGGIGEAAVDSCAKATLGDGAYCASGLGKSGSKQLLMCDGKKTVKTSTCAAGCAAMPDGVSDLCHDATPLTGPIDPDELLGDDHLLGDQQVTTSEVQGLLAHYGSALAAYEESGKSAAQMIVEQSKAQHVSPVYMLARINTESSLIESGTFSYLSQATGCGCPDGSACDPALAGFARQVDCAGRLIRGYYTRLAEQGSTFSAPDGWSVGVTKTTSDPCTITPANRATAVLYTYTPWVGAHAESCGTSAWGGSTLVVVYYRKYRAFLD